MEKERKQGEEIVKDLKENAKTILDIIDKKQLLKNSDNIDRLKYKIGWYEDRMIEIGGSVSRKGYFKSIDRVSDGGPLVLIPEGLHIAENLYVAKNDLNRPIEIHDNELAMNIFGMIYDYYGEKKEKLEQELENFVHQTE